MIISTTAYLAFLLIFFYYWGCIDIDSFIPYQPHIQEVRIREAAHMMGQIKVNGLNEIY